MGQFHYNTVDGTVAIKISLLDSRVDNYFRTWLIRQVTLGHSRQESYIKRQ